MVLYADVRSHPLAPPQLRSWDGASVVSHAGLPPMWPGFDSRTRRQMWVEFVVGSRPCSERFFSGYSGFPLSSKTNISKFQFDLEFEGHRFVSRIVLLSLFIYLFISCEKRKRSTGSLSMYLGFLFTHLLKINFL